MNIQNWLSSTHPQPCLGDYGSMWEPVSLKWAPNTLNDIFDRSKGPCKEFKIAKAVPVMLETLAKVFFRVRESKILFRESFAKVGYYNHYM